MKFYTKGNRKLLEDLERETSVLWRGKWSSTDHSRYNVEVCFMYDGEDDKYLSYDIAIEDKYDMYEVTNDSFVKYVKSILPKEKTVDDLQKLDKYYYLDSTLKISTDSWINHSIDKERREIKNCFLTEFEAELLKEKLLDILKGETF